jgi:hypothetical protein
MEFGKEKFQVGYAKFKRLTKEFPHIQEGE